MPMARQSVGSENQGGENNVGPAGRVLRWVCLFVLVGAPGLVAGERQTRHKLEWTHRYEGDVAPGQARPAWERSSGESAGDGVWRLPDPHCWFILGPSAGWDGDKDVAVEARFRITAMGEGKRAAGMIWLGSAQPGQSCALYYRRGKTGDEVSFREGFKPVATLPDTGKLHTCRITVDHGSRRAALVIDGAAEPALTTPLSDVLGSHRINRLLVGNPHELWMGGVAEWDYVRWAYVERPLPMASAKHVRWAGQGACRILAMVPPRDLHGRTHDEMPARIQLDLARVLKQFGVEGRPDLGRIQVIRYDPKTGEPRPCKTFRGLGPCDVAYRFDDFDRRRYTFWYNIEGNGHAGQLVWAHRQEGSSPSHYAVYFDAVKKGQEPGESPIPLLGDCDALYEEDSDGFLIGALHCKPTLCDWNGDGLLDVLVGEIPGHIFCFENRGTKQKPAFGRGRFLMLDGKPLKFPHYTTPCATDWDDDGDLDLIVGRSPNGQVLFFENVGSRTAPRLALRGRLEADGKPIVIPHELKKGESFLTREYMCKPEVADWDGDGDKDLLIGGYVSGAVFYCENVRDGKGVPKLAWRGPLEADGKTLRIGEAASPLVRDFDGDGDLDLITAKGHPVTSRPDPPDAVGMAFFENVGTRRRPKLRERKFPLARREHVGGVAVPTAGDWDGDGDLDLVIGTGAYVRFYRNVGSRTKPLFEKANTLKHKWGPVAAGGFATSPVDWDGDGDLDLVYSAGGQFGLKLNTDPRNPPRWADGGKLRAGGKVITYVFPPGDPETFPVMADLNRDGLPDLVQGVASGFVWFYKNIGTRTKPKLAEGTRLRLNDGGFVKVGYYKPGDKATDFASHSGDRSDPKPADFDGDGDLDLMVSDAYGFVTYFENVGGNASPVFAPGVKVLHERKARALIGVTDWDGDGRVDILLAQGSIVLCRNVGKGKKQVFKRDRRIPHQYIPYPHPYVVDWNGDGDKDLLVSSSYSVVYLIERSYAEDGYADAMIVGVERKP